MFAISSSNENVKAEVFINFRGELRKTFVSHLHDELKRKGIKSYIDSDEDAGEELRKILFKRIEESRVALAILSMRYSESIWCLEELVKIKECVDRRTLLVIPIFYNLNISTVKKLEGDFGAALWNLWRGPGRVRDGRILKWDAALQDVGGRTALKFEDKSGEDSVAFTRRIITQVQNALTKALTEPKKNPNPQSQIPSDSPSSSDPGKQRLNQLIGKLDFESKGNDETCILGIVGMAGIGKTYLANKLFLKLKSKINSSAFLQILPEMSKDQLQKKLVEDLCLREHLNRNNRNPLEVSKDDLLKKKVVIVLDDVTDIKHIDAVFENRDWIKKGSRILITTRDKSLLKKLDCVTYEVPGFNEREGLEFFTSHAFDDKRCKFLHLSREFVDYAEGNPLALQALGQELHEKDEGHWKTRLGTLTQISNEKIKKALRISFDELDEDHKSAFLDIACFFKSQDENYITSLLGESGKEVSKLADKFLIQITDGRVEMHNLYYTLARELAKLSSDESLSGNHRLLLSNSKDLTDALEKEEERDKVRGFALDMSEMEEMPLDNKAFVGMCNLRYLKIYNSDCPRQCEEHEQKLNLPDGLELPIDNLRYLHWLKYQEKQLPSDFDPKNLIDLKLPYSEITCLWNGAKATPKLKWVDLRHSRKLSSLLGLSETPNLLRLNLEGCLSLKELPMEIQNMKSLVFLNLRGCRNLSSLQKITVDSLKTLILSNCSKFHKFQVISKNLETLHLNGTAIAGLPKTIGNLHKLILLNLKDCKMLLTLPDSLGKLKSLQELKLSGCSQLNYFPCGNENMKKLRGLLLDRTAITAMPWSINSLSLLRRLCLSRNDNLRNLQFNISELYHLIWLELKYCKNLTSLPSLPPNLQCLDAHGCISLRTVSTPLAVVTPSDQIHSTFIFTNCHKLEQVSKNAIMSYVQKRGQMMSADRYNQGFVMKSMISTCFPGSEVPSWCNHKEFGSVLKRELLQHRDEGRLNGMALCAVVSFEEYKDQNNKSLQVNCTFEYTDQNNESLNQVNFTIGGWTKFLGDEPHMVKSDHVFVGYTNWFNIKNPLEEGLKRCVPSDVSLRFEVTSGSTSEIAECKVIKCGFSLVYEQEEEADNVFGEATSNIEESSWVSRWVGG